MTGRTCPDCGDDFALDLIERWGRAFLWMGCCDQAERNAEADLAAALDGCKEARRAFARWFEEHTGEALQGVFVSESDNQVSVNHRLRLGTVPQRVAKDFVRTHHVHHKPPAGWRWGHAVFNGEDLVAVAMVGRPVARMIDYRAVVEVNRVAARRDLDAALRRNACSMLYGAAARQARQRGFERIITYTLESELGSTVKAAGWAPVVKTEGGSWNRKSRARKDTAPVTPKVRWELAL